MQAREGRFESGRCGWHNTGRVGGGRGRHLNHGHIHGHLANMVEEKPGHILDLSLGTARQHQQLKYSPAPTLEPSAEVLQCPRWYHTRTSITPHSVHLDGPHISSSLVLRL